MGEVLSRLRSHILQMAPHQRMRYSGKLLIEAANEIERLLQGVTMGDTQTETERDHDNFRLLVMAVRRAQREYYASQDTADLRNVRRLEAEVDKALLYER